MLNDIISESLKEVIGENLKMLGTQVSAALVTLLVGIILSKGVDYAHTWLKTSTTLTLTKASWKMR